MPQRPAFDCASRRLSQTAAVRLAAGLTVLAALTIATSIGRPIAASELRYTAIVKAVQNARPSIVNIHGRKTVPADPQEFGTGEVRRVNGMGTGVVIDERGYVVTNYHVVEGVSQIQVTLADNTTVVARLIAHDPKTDLAVIKIPTETPLPVITIGTSSDLMAGESVVAVGNAYGYDHTATRGIISALHRTVQVSDTQKYYDLIQTDASINPGNSGGPLLNIDGEMIAINVAVRVGAQGIGFAIPVDKAMEVAADLISTQRLENRGHGLIGESQVDDNHNFRYVVRAVRPDTPAAKCGLKPGDVVSSIGGVKVQRALDIERALIGRSLGEEVPVVVERNAQSEQLSLVVAPGTGRDMSEQDRVWVALGLRLSPVPADDFRRLSSRYRGGLQVLDVRNDSPAFEQGIRRGDVLVGMHIWETLSLDNVSYILKRPDFADFEPVKFYILRDNETLYGHLTVSHREVR